jgi:hypothetical protein
MIAGVRFWPGAFFTALVKQANTQLDQLRTVKQPPARNDRRGYFRFASRFC